MLHLAASLIVDLGLSQTSALETPQHLTESSFVTFAEDIPLPKEPSLDERRAILGLSYINSLYVRIATVQIIFC
jgi:hypothetical protein